MEERRWGTLRAAVYRGDGAAALAWLGGEVPDDALQLGGAGVLMAIAQGVDGASEVASRWAAALRTRGWIGDDDLADEIDAAVGAGPIPMLRALPVDLEQLSDILEGDPLEGGGRVDLRSGEVWPRAAIEYAAEVGDDEPDDAHWLAVDSTAWRDGYRDMERFIDTVEDPARADRLAIAISGRGAFRRFKDVLARWPGELDRWHAYSEERRRGRARAWLAATGRRPRVPAQPPRE